MKYQNLINKIDNFVKFARINVDSLKYLEKFITSEENPKFFFTMTEIAKIGINPKSTYQTPLGVYCYPLTEEYYNKLIKNTLPFAGNQKYINLFSISDSVNNLSKYSETNLKNDENKLFQLYESMGKEKFDVKKEYAYNAAYLETAVSKFWNFTRLLAGNLLKWNVLFRKLGYTNFYDPGISIIHGNEPTQAVIFDPSIIIPIESFLNPYDSDINRRKKVNFEKIKESDIDSLIGKNNTAIINNFSQILNPRQILKIVQTSTTDSLYYYLNLLKENKYLKEDNYFFKKIIEIAFNKNLNNILEVVSKNKNNISFTEGFVLSGGISISKAGKIEYYTNGKLSREDGPAVISSDTNKEYWFKDEYYGDEKDYTDASWIEFVKTLK